MPVGDFQIETYAISHGRAAAGPRAVIMLYAAQTSGPLDRAQLLFSPTNTSLSGTADNVGVASAGIQVFADLPYSDFAPMYDLVRNEAPVRLWYEYGSSSTPSKPLDYISITTYNNELPGEGPADADSFP